MGLPGLLRLAMLVVLGLAFLLSGCAGARPRLADETRVEEWGRCQGDPRATFTALCLETRRPL